MLTYVKGSVLAQARPHSVELLESLGRLLGEMDKALESFSHEAAERELKWDSAKAGWIRKYLGEIADAGRRRLVDKFLMIYENDVAAALPGLRRSVIYGDANDHNVLVNEAWPLPRRVVSVIDFGDIHHGITVSEVAIAAAYAILGKKEPLAAAVAVVRGYHAAYALEEKEIEQLYALIGMRLAVSVTNSAHRKVLRPEDAYVTISETPAWEALEKWAAIPSRFAQYYFRAACGMEAVPQSGRIVKWLQQNSAKRASILQKNLRTAPSIVFDLSAGSTFLGADPGAGEAVALSEKIFGAMRNAGCAVGVGRFNEARLLYTSAIYGGGENPVEERRTVHLGIDLFVTPGTPLFAPLEGTVEVLANNKAALDYGPLVILRHTTSEGDEFFTLYGHLTVETLSALKVGQKIARGEKFGSGASVGTRGLDEFIAGCGFNLGDSGEIFSKERA
jgi:Phosphotransferase enzyme family/Peptidase family M23